MHPANQHPQGRDLAVLYKALSRQERERGGNIRFHCFHFCLAIEQLDILIQLVNVKIRGGCLRDG